MFVHFTHTKVVNKDSPDDRPAAPAQAVVDSLHDDLSRTLQVFRRGLRDEGTTCGPNGSMRQT